MKDNSVINKDDFYKFIYEVVLDSLIDRVDIIKSFNNNVQAYLDNLNDCEYDKHNVASDLGKKKSKRMFKERKYKYNSIDVAVSTWIQGITVLMFIEEEQGENHFYNKDGCVGYLAKAYINADQDFTKLASNLYSQLSKEKNLIMIDKAILKDATIFDTPSTPVKKERRFL